MAMRGYQGPLERVNSCCWRIPRSYKPGMRVDGLIYANEWLIDRIRDDPAPEQVANVAFLPGIQCASLAMPDIHWGYGFPIGGVCATDPAEGGVISPGGVGYDINCGVRLVRTNLSLEEVEPHLEPLMSDCLPAVPTGVGRGGKYRFSHRELQTLMASGPQALADRGLATARDTRVHRGGGPVAWTPIPTRSVRVRWIAAVINAAVWDRATTSWKSRSLSRFSMNRPRGVMGLQPNQVVVMIHSGSRGLGYQVCDDALKQLRHTPAEYGIQLPDRQLICAPIESPAGQTYLGAMRAAANFAWCNRQLLMWQAREVFEHTLGRTWQDLDMQLVYDVAHNIAKCEEHTIHGVKKPVWVHRKGATRAFPPHHPELPAEYSAIGQPVLIPGDMGRASCGVGGTTGEYGTDVWQRMPRSGAPFEPPRRRATGAGRRIDHELRERGIIALARSWRGLAEEQPDAYKDVDVVVTVVHQAGLARKVARLRPIGVIKG